MSPFEAWHGRCLAFEAGQRRAALIEAGQCCCVVGVGMGDSDDHVVLAQHRSALALNARVSELVKRFCVVMMSVSLDQHLLVG